MVAYMNRHGDGYWGLCVLDGAMNDVYFEIDPELPLWRNMNPHPLNRARVVASWLDRDERFRTHLFRGHDSMGRDRLLRLYTLKEEFRNPVTPA